MNRHSWMLPTFALIAATSIAQAQNLQGYGPPLKETPEHAARVAAAKARMQQEDALRRQAEEAIRKGELAQAAPLYKQILSLDEDHASRICLADIYMRSNRPNDVLQTLRPIVYPAPRVISSIGSDITTRMKYVLALLDTKQWSEAATLYEQSLSLHTRSEGPLMWYMQGYGIGSGDQEHTLSVAHFSPEAEDVPGLRAQAHLILGTRSTSFPTLTDLENNLLAYQLDQVRQSLKSRPHSQEAQFIEGRLLMEMKRYPEARVAFSHLSQTAPREVQAEIKSTVARMDQQEQTKRDNQRAWERRQKAQTVNAQTKPGG